MLFLTQKFIFWMLFKRIRGAGEVAQHLRVLATLAQTRVWFSAPTWAAHNHLEVLLWGLGHLLSPQASAHPTSNHVHRIRNGDKILQKIRNQSTFLGSYKWTLDIKQTVLTWGTSLTWQMKTGLDYKIRPFYSRSQENLGRNGGKVNGNRTREKK